MLNVWLCSLAALGAAFTINATDVSANGNSTTVPLATVVGESEAAEHMHQVDPLSNAAIYGCRWPSDFVTRVRFCAERAGVPLRDAADDGAVVSHGVLDGRVLDELMDGCEEGKLEHCVRQVNSKHIEEFVVEWQSSVDNYTALQSCLQTNTEAMNRLCGADHEVSKVASGSAGLHLNLLNVLVNVERQARSPAGNVSAQCLHKVAEAVHVTAALYLKSGHYKQNSVLCWAAARNQCDKTCAAFAAELNCLHAACPGLPAATLQQLGIWQWYYLDPASARAKCDIHDEECTVTDSGIVPVDTTSGMSSLFDVDRLKEKFNAVKHDLEQRFHMPFATIAVIFSSAFGILLLLFTIFCCWAYGALVRRRRTTRYSRLLDSKLAAAESRALSTLDDGDDDDIE